MSEVSYQVQVQFDGSEWVATDRTYSAAKFGTTDSAREAAKADREALVQAGFAARVMPV